MTGHDISARAVDAFDSVDKANPAPLLVFAVLAGFGAPIVEEIAFRGLLFGSLEKRGMPTGACVVITAVGFAVFHFEPARFLVLLPIAFALGLARRANRVDGVEHRRSHDGQPAGRDHPGDRRLPALSAQRGRWKPPSWGAGGGCAGPGWGVGRVLIGWYVAATGRAPSRSSSRRRRSLTTAAMMSSGCARGGDGAR